MLTQRGDDRVGRVLGDRYRLHALVGVGGQARVYLADDVRLRRQVAVKMLHAGLARNSVFLRRFTAEARAAAALSHPNLLAVFDHGEEDDGPFLVTEFLGGGSLRSLLDEHGPLSPSQSLKVAMQSAAGLHAAHARGMVHRDIKPANLLFGDEARLRIADFGLVRALHEAALTEPDGSVQGTARYLPPEAGSVRPLDERSDVYSLALTIVEAATGEVPLAGGSVDEVLARRRSVGRIELPERLGPGAAALSQALRRDPDDRPTALELGKALIEAAPAYRPPDPLPLVRTVTGPVDTDRTALVTPGEVDLDEADDEPVREVRSRVERPGDRRRRRRTEAARPTGRAGTVDAQVMPPRRRLRFLRNVVLGVVVVAAAAWVASIMLAEEPVLTELGDWQGRPVEALEGFAAGSGWELDVAREFDDTLDAGLVVSTDPTPGVELEEGATVAVVVSDGPRPVDLDDLAGLDLNDAIDRITELGLIEGGTPRENDEDIEAGIVLRTEVDGEIVTDTRSVAPGTAVTLVVSAGPVDRVVPEVRGASVEDATNRLAEEALGIAETEPAFSETVEAGRIIDQLPLPGAQLERDGTVTVTVSKGPDRRQVPELENLTIDQARAALEEVGLGLGQVFGPPEAEVIVGYASGQGPGSSHAPGTAIDVVAGF
ncbi:MAG: protein kinase [Actinomycetota bacterium]